MPERNRKDLLDVPDQAKKDIEFIFCSTMDEVLKSALETQPFTGGEGEGEEGGGKKKKGSSTEEGSVRA
jgi:ATP-dependent Lon protease